MTDHRTDYKAVGVVASVDGSGPDVTMLGEVTPKPMYERVTVRAAATGQDWTLVFDSMEHGRHRRGDLVEVAWTHTTEQP